MMKKPIIILTGPTAVGKTSSSIALAKAIGGEIISADSMQIYRYMDVGTAKITPEEMDGVRHYLVDEILPDTPFHVYEFKKMAEHALDEIYKKGKIPIVVGGTGFYIQALLYDIDFCQEDNDYVYRHELEELAKTEGCEILHRMLQQVDADSAKAIHANNVKRVIRALEYYKETGKPISQHNEEQRQKESPYNFLYLVLTMERKILYERINLRVEQMVNQGLLEEMEQLIQRGYTKELVSMQAIGYKELFPYFEGEITREEAIDQIKKDTRHFAKRQLTWFRRERDVTFLDKMNYADEKELVNAMVQMAKDKKIIE